MKLNLMNSIKDYPQSLRIMTEWFLNDLRLSVKENPDVPEDFREHLLLKGVLTEHLQVLIEVSPRLYFDVFDAHDILINIVPIKDIHKPMFVVNINDEKVGKVFDKRKEADLYAVEQAFGLLEQKLIKTNTIDESTTI